MPKNEISGRINSLTIDEVVIGIARNDLVLRLAGPLREVPEALAGLDARLNSGSELVARFQLTEMKTLGLLNRARGAGWRWRDFSIQEPGLKNLFLSLTLRRDEGPGAAA